MRNAEDAAAQPEAAQSVQAAAANAAQPASAQAAAPGAAQSAPAAQSPRLAWATPALLEGHTGPPPILLGAAGGAAHFALDISQSGDPLNEYGWQGAAEFPDLRAAAGLLPPGEAAIAAQARHLTDWHARHRHCPGCGAATTPEQAGWSRRCPECSALHFPRTDPVVIAVVTDGARCLLGRQSGWPRNLYSALAGFVEPGESVEEAVAREVREESGVRVHRVRYLASQPWPFPASLMLGCHAEATSTALRVDSAELEDARWFPRSEIRSALHAPTPTLTLPPPVAIAHHLIKTWAEN